jgi:hypothetical protein
MKVARIITTYKCPKDCKDCCNKNWKGIPAKVMDNYDYDMFLITGGEPMLFPNKVRNLILSLMKENANAKIIMYTASTKKLSELLMLTSFYLDGLTITLHDNKDTKSFIKFNEKILNLAKNGWKDTIYSKSLRLNIFKEVKIPKDTDLSMWKIKSDMVWLKDCPLPEGEELLKLKELW